MCEPWATLEEEFPCPVQKQGIQRGSGSSVSHLQIIDKLLMLKTGVGPPRTVLDVFTSLSKDFSHYVRSPS